MASAQFVGEPPAASAVGKPVAAGEDMAAVAWREFGRNLVQAAMHSPHLVPEDGAALRQALMAVLDGVKGEPAEEVVRKFGQEAAAELERHNKATQQELSKTLGELRETISALSEGLTKLTGKSEVATHIAALQTIVTSATSTEELEAGRAQVEGLIELIGRKEDERAQRQQSFVNELQRRIEELEKAESRTGAEAARELVAQAPTTDTLTGVPNGVAAREAVLNCQTSDRPPHVAVIHIQCLDVLNARFGQRIGDQIVLTCCQHLASSLCRETDRIFRWRGPAFVVLLDRDDSPAGVGREVSHACNSISSSFFGEPHRSILIPVKMASAMIPIESRLITDVFDSIERFIVRSGRPNS
jgi:GGDEF domain-containing protein